MIKKDRAKGTNSSSHITRKWKVWNHTVCLQCFVHAHSEREALEMARARNSLFEHKDTEAEVYLGVPV